MLKTASQEIVQSLRQNETHIRRFFQSSDIDVFDGLKKRPQIPVAQGNVVQPIMMRVRADMEAFSNGRRDHGTLPERNLFYGMVPPSHTPRPICSFHKTI